jgi:hypothetical protein
MAGHLCNIDMLDKGMIHILGGPRISRYLRKVSAIKVGM